MTKEPKFNWKQRRMMGDIPRCLKCQTELTEEAPCKRCGGQYWYYEDDIDRRNQEITAYWQDERRYSEQAIWIP